jgi:hypothetical protein
MTLIFNMKLLPLNQTHINPNSNKNKKNCSLTQQSIFESSCKLSQDPAR